ncbi:delta-aminolevulinic acid dehydratase [Chryseolinea sp. H1M3-3]|uniref:delta-aminolevulinic acid dehydratase n=1 Tax=Chryseolinea sp. H1M3-3 TaxID=3034144 RepID=UPI0023EC879F|nr:delta-aminolevulinic acid dehydratase [Chryseolinea sp. H1M3-3]
MQTNTGVDKIEKVVRNKHFEDSYTRLKNYCENESFKGWDPYDGLNSKIFQAIPFIRSNRIARLCWIQFFKRSPINFRRPLKVLKEHNNKGLGLFLAGYCKEFKTNPTRAVEGKIIQLAEILVNNRSTQYAGSSWGYNFDWQARAFFQPKNTPTVVATTFISSALLDAYEITKNDKFLNTARTACNFILHDLNRTYDEKGNFAFSYSPLDHSVVFNASLLGSRLLARVSSITGENGLIEEAKKSVAFCCDRQQSDGSWRYGALPFHQWIDNFHTGYNLECINDYMKFSGDATFQKSLDRGFTYYIHTFFTEEGIPRYYSNNVYPIDIHSPAQLVITLSKLEKFKTYKKLLDNVLDWTINNMQSDKGYFYYQINKYFSSKIAYMRWAQAWMFYALSTYFYEESKITN